MGGMISVGCSLVRVSRREANSEYRLRTMSSYSQGRVSRVTPEQGTMLLPYPGLDGVHNVSAAILRALSRIYDQNRKFWALVEHLLDAAVVAARLASGH